MKIIQIDGIKGLITALFVGVCSFAGFVLFPGTVAMNLWNKYLVNMYMFPTLNLFQGVLLWAMAVISYCIVSKKGLAISFKNTPELSEEELNSIIKSAKISSQVRMMNRIISNSDRFNLKNDKSVQNSLNEKDSSFISTPSGLGKSSSLETSDDDIVSKLK